MLKKYDGMSLKEHIELAEAMAEKNVSYTKGGISTSNPQKAIYRLIGVIKEMQKEIKELKND